jgi:hypothetical protein
MSRQRRYPSDLTDEQWERDKVTDTMLTVLREQLRVQQGRHPQPSAGMIDSQSVKGAVGSAVAISTAAL